MAQIGGLDPSVLVSPDYQVQMQQAERQRALAAALRAQSLQDTPGNGGSISWTQGIARIADALAAGINNKRADKTQLGANQDYARGMASMFGLPPGQNPQTPQGVPPSSGGPPMPQQAPQAPQQAPAGPPADPLAVLPDAPPQAAPPQPAAAPMPPQGGAPSMGPMNLTGDPRRDMGLYVMNPEKYGEAMIGNAAKGTAPTDIEIMMSHAGIDPTSTLGRQIMQQSLAKQNYIAPTTGRPGGWTIYPDGHKEFNPQAPAPGAMPVIVNGQPTGAWTEDPSAAGIQAHQAGAIAGAQEAGKAPYHFEQVYINGQMYLKPVSELAGSPPSATPSPTPSASPSPGKYTPGAGGSKPSAGYASGPPIGAVAGANTFSTNQANRFQQIQDNAAQSRQQEQSLYELEGLVGKGLKTGPWLAKQQDFAEKFGLTPLANSDAIVFNKDSARLITQMAQNVGLNGSDQRLGMLSNATPNLHMTPEALKQILPVVHGLSFANRAMADASANWLKTHNNDLTTMPEFDSWWRQNYDPRMFTALTHGPASFKAELAHLPPDKRQQYMQKYYALREGGVNFAQFAQ